MPVVEKKTGVDVLTAARQRIDDSLSSVDSFLVMFSGGKDSQVVLHLVHEWAEREGRLPIDVVFLDEELLPSGVIRTIEHYAIQGWIRMHWFVVPMHNAKAAMNRSEGIVTWDPDRVHLRPMPKNQWVLRREPGDDTVRSQQSMDGYVYQRSKMNGSAVFVTGIRADESLNRRQAIKQRRSRPHMASSSDPRVELARPIYDWGVDDVFRYLRSIGVKECDEYQGQALAGMRMRISTPLHGEAIRELDKVRSVDTTYLQGLFNIFPDVELHTRYAAQLERHTMSSFASCTMADCARFIQGMDDAQKKHQALLLFRRFIVHHRRAPEAYPAALLMFNLVKGTTQRSMLQPLALETQQRMIRAAKQQESPDESPDR